MGILGYTVPGAWLSGGGGYRHSMKGKTMKNIRKIVEIDEELCDGCGECAPSCEEGAIQIVDGKARLLAEKYCDGLGACLGECPKGALTIVEREVDTFDEAAVEEHLAAVRGQESEQAPCGCPVVQTQTVDASPGEYSGPAHSALSHWPVQIRLVPPTAPFLRNARLLVTADCVPVAYPRFHEDLLRGRVVLQGCPKFDDMALYEQRFADLFAANDIQDVTVAVMEVPCCQGLPVVVQRGMARAGKDVPLEKVVLTLQGQILEREAVMA